MFTPLPHANRRAFSWTECIVLVAVLGVLAAILIPTVGRVRECTPRSIVASNLRNIGQASLIYAMDHEGQLPGLHLDGIGNLSEASITPHIHAIAAALARDGGLDDGQIWFAPEDRTPSLNRKKVTTVLTPSKGGIDPEFARSALSFQYIAGLHSEMSSLTPIAFTRGLQPNGQWADDRTLSVNGDEGGHIVFLGGNVDPYINLQGDNALVVPGTNHRTENILETVPAAARIFSKPATPTGTLAGLPGLLSEAD